MKLFCQAGEHEWERPPQRGRPPLNCPEHAAAPKPKSGRTRAENNSPERMAQLRAINSQREQERAALAVEAEQQRRAELEASLPQLNEEYEQALELAMSSNTKAAWQKAEILQARIIGTRKAIR